jgi:hypothetical protein
MYTDPLHIHQSWADRLSFTTILTRPKERKLEDKQDGEKKKDEQRIHNQNKNIENEFMAITRV